MSRQKQIEITDQILDRIEKVTGTTVDPDSVVVFEAAAASTRPITKAGSIYDGAIMSRTMLQDMAAALNSGEESVPLHTLHQQGWEIPVGRVFHGAVHDEPDGSATLRTMFYLPLEEKELIEKVNLAVLDEVSVGVKSEKALCSKCGFDYMGDEADFENFWDRTCNNGHVIGEDGTHLKLTGVDTWTELSLVSRGASDKAKILSRPKTLLSPEAYDRLAADGKPVECLFLHTSMAPENPQMPKPNLEAGNASNTPAPDGAAEFNAQEAFETLAASLPGMIQTAVEAAVAPEPEPEPTVEELQAQLAEANTALGEANTKIQELEAAAAPQTPPVNTPEVPAGGVAASAETESDPTALKAAANRAVAFKSPTKR